MGVDAIETGYPYVLRKVLGRRNHDGYKWRDYKYRPIGSPDCTYYQTHSLDADVRFKGASILSPRRPGVCRITSQ